MKTEKKASLVSDGNPQIPKGEGDAPVQAEWKHDIGRQLDALIVRYVPKVKKAVKWNSPFYGIEGKGWFLSFHVYARYVKVTFYAGTSLHPVPPGESKHKDVRCLDIGKDGFNEAQLTWVKHAAKRPGWVT